MDRDSIARRALTEALQRWRRPDTLPAESSVSATEVGPLAGVSINDFKIRGPGPNGAVDFEGDSDRDWERAKEFFGLFGGTGTPVPIAQSAPPRIGSGVLLSVAIEKYVAERSKSGAWGKASQNEFPQFLNTFLEIVGDQPVALVDKATFERFREKLQLLPPNRRKDKFFRTRTLAQVLVFQEGTPAKSRKTISAKTADSYITAVHGLLSWCEDRGYLERNPASGGTILKGSHKKKNGGKTRLGFDPDELKTVFDPARFNAFTRPDRFWVPLISLFSGARLNEIADLRVSEISPVDPTEDDSSPLWGIYVRGGKTEASERKFPVHPILIDIGLLQYVADVRKRGQKQLFPNLNECVKGRGRAVSRWFADYLEALGITAPEKVFHSFRHTMTTHLTGKGVDESTIQRLIGHENGSVTGRYVDDYSTRDLNRNVFPKIAFRVDFSGIRYDSKRFEKALSRCSRAQARPRRRESP